MSLQYIVHIYCCYSLNKFWFHYNRANNFKWRHYELFISINIWILDTNWLIFFQPVIVEKQKKFIVKIRIKKNLSSHIKIAYQTNHITLTNCTMTLKILSQIKCTTNYFSFFCIQFEDSTISHFSLIFKPNTQFKGIYAKEIVQETINWRV